MFELLGVALIITLLALVGSIGLFMYYILVIHPKQEKDSLEMFSVMAVNEASLRYPGMGTDYQAQKSEQKLRDILTEKGMMLVGDMTISAAVGSAMYKRKQEEENLAGIDRMLTSVKLPAMRKPKPAPRTPKINLEEIIL